jgi:HAD superfamily hydrolase (TIGR01509 family)
VSAGAVIFDCDGVLVDSEPLANRVLSDLLGEHGVAMTPEECREAFVGLNPGGVAKKLMATRGVDLTGVLVGQASERFMVSLEREGLTPVEGVADLLGRLRGGGVLLAVASNSPMPELTLKLRLAGLREWFGAHTHSGDQIGRSKPDPGVYLAAASGLGVAPTACTVVEDTPTGVRAGVAAGMRVIGFTGAHPEPGQDERLVGVGAWRVARDMREVGALLASE